VPSRLSSKEHQEIKKQIDGIVGYINGKYGTIDWTPVIYQFRALDIQHLVALYRVSDVMLIPSLRDGMNLIAKEYIASRQDGKGVLILSQFAGASAELTDALIINPYSDDAIAKAIKLALQMTPHDKAVRNKRMQDHLSVHTICRWGNEFLQRLLISRDTSNTNVQ